MKLRIVTGCVALVLFLATITITSVEGGQCYYDSNCEHYLVSCIAEILH